MGNNMDNNKNIFLLYHIEVMTKKEPFWFCLGAAFGLYCGVSVFHLSFDNITIWSYLDLMLIAFIFGMTYKDI
jgi:hypothetical protein